VHNPSETQRTGGHRRGVRPRPDRRLADGARLDAEPADALGDMMVM
jgi:hypothetical protein